MKRREFVQKLGIAPAAAATVLGAGKSPAKTPAVTSHEQQEHDDHRPVTGSLATATVSFGEWQTNVPIDRYPPAPPIPPPPPGGGHLLVPHQVTIKLGGTVNYI